MVIHFIKQKQKVAALLALSLAFLLANCAKEFDLPVTETHTEKAYVTSADGTLAVITHGHEPKHVATLNAGGSADVTAAFGHVYVNNSGANSVTIIDANKDVVKGTTSVGVRPVHSLMVKGGNLLLVGNDGPSGSDPENDPNLVAADDTVSVIDTNPNNATFMMEIARIRVGNGHHKLAYSDKTERAAISNLSAGTVTIIDVNALSVMCTVKVGAGASPVPHGIDYSPVSGKAYNANVSGGETEAITMIHLNAAITVPANPYKVDDPACTALDGGGIARGTGPGQIPASGYTHANHAGTFVFTVGYTAASQTGHLSVIRTSDDTVVSVLDLPKFKPDQFVITEDGDRIYVSSVEDENNTATVPGTTVAVVDIDTTTGEATLHPTTPFLQAGRGHDHRAIALSGDDARLFVPNSGADPGTVSVFDTASLALLGTFEVGEEPNALAYVDAATLALPEGGGGGGHSH